MFIHPCPKVDTGKIFQQNANFVANLDRAQSLDNTNVVQLLEVSGLIQKITIALPHLVFRPLGIPPEGFHDDTLPFVASKPNVAEASPIQKAFENESVWQNLSRDHG
jgi:hypothetical protein